MGGTNDDGGHPVESTSPNMKQKPLGAAKKKEKINPLGLARSGTLFSTLPKVRITSLTPEQRREILSELFYDGPERFPYYRRFYFLLAISAVIATVGLGHGSPALVIGGMLLAPLMTPILSGAAALALGWPIRQARMAVFLAIATAFTFGVAVLVPLAFQLPKEFPVPEEILSRTRPALGDLLVALCAGAAGAYVLIRKEAISALPGVAMAVALVPPICSAGILVYVEQYSLALQAFLLYLTNLAAIVLAAGVVFVVMGFTPRVAVKRFTLRVAAGGALAVIFVSLIAIPLLFHTVTRFADIRERHQAILAVKDWIGTNDIELVDLWLKEDEAEVHLVIDLPFAVWQTRDTATSLVFTPAGLTRVTLERHLQERLGRKLDLKLKALLRFET